jgi:hypothetical protein
MRRREFIAGLGAATWPFAWPLVGLRRGLMRRGSWSPNASPAIGAGELLGWPPVRA